MKIKNLLNDSQFFLSFFLSLVRTRNTLYISPFTACRLGLWLTYTASYRHFRYAHVSELRCSWYLCRMRHYAEVY